MSRLYSMLVDTGRLLTFRQPSRALHEHWPAYLCFGLLLTGLAGIGRYWDNPRAHLWQHLGLGSLAYVCALAAVLWLLILPLAPQRWSYRNVLVFLTLTAPPALLYAIPVERFVELDTAQSLNAWFLALVASWRVALLVWFLRRVAGLGGLTIVVATLLPLALIVCVLAALNLEHAVFSFMAGLEVQQSPNDLSYQVVTGLALLSLVTGPFLLLAYGALVYLAQVRKRPIVR